MEAKYSISGESTVVEDDFIGRFKLAKAELHLPEAAWSVNSFQNEQKTLTSYIMKKLAELCPQLLSFPCYSDYRIFYCISPVTDTLNFPTSFHGLSYSLFFI